MAKSPPPTPLAIILAQRNGDTFDILGDSIMHRNYRVLSTGLALSVSGTTCTMTLTGHGMYTGMRGRYVDRGQSGLMGYHTITGYIDANNVTFDVPAGTPASPTVDLNQGSAWGFPERRPDDGFINQFLSLMQQRMTLVNNWAVSGDATSHVLARMAEFLASTSSKFIIMLGTNDARNGVSVATYSANMLSIVSQILNIGATVDICTVLPLTGTPPVGTTASCNQLIVGYNKFLHQLIRSDPRIALAVDAYKVATDGTSSTAAAKSGMLTSEGIHLAPQGSTAVGSDMAANYTNRLSLGDDRVVSMLDSYLVDSTNKQLLANPLMQGTGGSLAGGATGSVPTNWTVTMTSATSVVASIVARADGIGNDLVGTMVASSSSSRMRFDSEALQAKFVAGHKYFLEGDVYFDPSSPIGSIGYELTTTTTSGSVNVLYLALTNAGNGTPTADGVMHTLRTADFVLPVGLSSAAVRLDAFASGAGTLIMKLGRAQLQDIT